MGETFEKDIKYRPINGPEPALREKGQMPISNRLRPEEIFERDRCTSGWSDISDHSTNPVEPTKQQFPPTSLYTQAMIASMTNAYELLLTQSNLASLDRLNVS